MRRIMNKKQKILKQLEGKTWHNGSTTFTKDDFIAIDLDSSYELGETYNDVIYTRRILQKEGYKVLMGTYGLYLHNKDSIYFKNK